MSTCMLELDYPFGGSWWTLAQPEGQFGSAPEAMASEFGKETVPTDPLFR